MADLDLTAIELFVNIVELGSVSKAATRSHLSQPSVTAKIRKLERQLGVVLLERTPTGSTPTAAGRSLLGRCEEALTAATALRLSAQQLRSFAQATLRVAATPNISRYHLAELLAPVKLEGTRFTIVEGSTKQIANAARKGDVDLAFSDGPQAPLGLRSVVIATTSIVAVHRPGHAGRAGLGQQALVGLPPDDGARHCTEEALAPTGFAGYAHEAPSLDAAILDVVAGHGLGFFSQRSVASHLRAGRLVEVNTPITPLAQPLRMAWRGKRPSEESAARLVAALTPPAEDVVV